MNGLKLKIDVVVGHQFSFYPSPSSLKNLTEDKFLLALIAGESLLREPRVIVTGL